MSRTPDRFPGPREDEAIILDPTQVASADGEIRYTGTRFSLQDSTGEYDPRSGSGLSSEQHKTLRQLIHFIDEGPAEGFVSGAYKESSYSGILLTSAIWWESSSKLKKIVEETLTWSGILLQTDEWKMYDTDGSTVLVTVSDAITYSGVFEVSRTRTIT